MKEYIIVNPTSELRHRTLKIASPDLWLARKHQSPKGHPDEPFLVFSFQFFFYFLVLYLERYVFLMLCRPYERVVQSRVKITSG